MRHSFLIHPFTSRDRLCTRHRPRRVVGRAALVGDAAGYVTKCSGEGIYFAAKSGRMAGQAVSKVVSQTGQLPSQQQMMEEYIKPYDKLYGPTYTVLDILQKVRAIFVSFITGCVVNCELQGVLHFKRGERGFRRALQE